jgi:hypothetical protein
VGGVAAATSPAGGAAGGGGGGGYSASGACAAEPPQPIAATNASGANRDKIVFIVFKNRTDACRAQFLVRKDDLRLRVKW